MKKKKGPNPFRPRTMIWALYEEDWSDLTVPQIAEVFSTSPETVHSAISKVKQVTDYRVPHVALSPKGKPLCK